MHITVYRHSLLNRGGDKVIAQYANYLLRQGHVVTLYTNELNSLFELAPNITVKRISWKGKIGSLAYGILNRLEGDVIVADIIAMALCLSVRHSRRIFYFAQADDTQYYSSPFLKQLIRLFYTIGLKQLKIPCAAVSSGLQTALRNYSTHVQVIPNGIDLTAFHRSPSQELQAKKQGRKTIMILARDDHRKGLDTALNVLRELPRFFAEDKIEVWTFNEEVIPGQIPYKVINWGYPPEEKLVELLSTADLFLYPSRHEGFGLLVLEAMACGCPVVTTKSVPIVTHLRNAWVSNIDDRVHLGEGVSRILTNPEFAQGLVQGGFQLARQYNIENSYRGFETILINAVRSCRPPS